MSANSEITVAQFANGTAARMPLGKGVIHNRPRTHHRMTGTQIQCSASLVGLRWLEPYSSSHCSAVRIGRRYALIAGNSIAAGQPFDGVWPIVDLVELALLLRLELIELLGGIAGGVALDAGSRDKIRTAVNLLPILVD